MQARSIKLSLILCSCCWPVCAGEKSQPGAKAESKPPQWITEHLGRDLKTLEGDEAKRLFQDLRLEGHKTTVTAMAFSPNGRLLATADQSHPMVWIWSTSEKKVMGKLVGPENTKASITSIAFSPDGKRIAAASYDFAAIWDVDREKRLAELMLQEGSIYCVSYSPDGKSIAVGAENAIHVTPSDEWKWKRTYECPKGDIVGALAFAPDSKNLFCWKGTVTNSAGVLVELNAGTKLGDFSGGHQLPARFSSIIGDDRIVTAGYDGRIVVWNAQKKQPIKSYTLDGSPIESFAHSAKASLIVCGTSGGTLWLLQIDQGKVKSFEIAPISCAALSPDGKKLAVTHANPFAFRDERFKKGIIYLIDVGKLLD